MKHTLHPLLLLALLAPALPSPAASQAPPELPLPVASFGATATPDGHVYIYGGHSGKRHRYNRDEVHGDFFQWQAGMNQWQALAKDEPSQGASLLATPKGILRIGGMAAKNAAADKQDLWSSETASRYDPADKQWHPLPKLPERRSSHDSIVIGDTLYVIGGWALGGETRTASGAKWHDTYLTLDLAQKDASWQSHPQPFQRRALAVHAIGTQLYAIGGMDSDEEITTAVSILDTASGHWTEGPALPKDRLGGFGFAAVSHEGRLFASGAAGVLLELRGQTWVPLAKLQYPRFFHRLVSGGKGKLIALGGESRDGQKASPEIIELPAANSAPLADEPAPRKTSASRPSAKSIVWPTNLPAAESDWPRYQGPVGDCTTPEVGWTTRWPADGPPILWKAEFGKGLGSFAVQGKRAYTAGNDGANKDTLLCVDLETGKPLWKHTFAEPTKCHQMAIVPYGPAATPTVSDGKVWFISRDGLVLCLDAQKGRVLWQKHLIHELGGKRPVYGFSSSPYVNEGRLYLDAGGQGGSNLCLDAATGKVLWKTGDGEAGYATPFITRLHGKDTLILFKGQALELRAAADGSLLSRHATETRDFCNCATPVLSGETLFISHTGNMGARVLKADELALTEVWSDREIGLLFHSGIPVGTDKLLVFNDQVRGANDLRLLDLTTGETLWKNTEIEKGTGLITADGHALLLTSKGELVLAKVLADKLDILQRAQILSGKCWVQPVLSHRRLLCKNNEGSTVCLDLR